MGRVCQVQKLFKDLKTAQRRWIGREDHPGWKSKADVFPESGIQKIHSIRDIHAKRLYHLASNFSFLVLSIPSLRAASWYYLSINKDVGI